MSAFNRHDAERLETLTQTVDKWRKKAGLTTLDLMVACRFILANKFEWEECIDAASHEHAKFIAYYDTGANEEDATDRRIAELEAEIAGLRAENRELGEENKMMRVRADAANGIGAWSGRMNA